MSSSHPGKSPARLRFEDLSRGPLQKLNRVPKALIVIGMAAMLIGGLLAPAVVGVPLLLVLALFLAWLVALSWPILTPGPRLMRVVTVGLVLFAAWMRASGR